MKRIRRGTTEASSSRPNRQRPTASARRQRAAPPDHIEDTIEVEDVATTQDSNVEVHAEPTEPSQIGLIDPYLLTSFKTHIAAAIWNNQEYTDSEEYIMYSARAYLLYLLGCTLFIDKTGTRVQIVYLRLLRNLDSVAGYSWGSGCLAWLYRQLGQASRSKVKQIAGYMTLLEAWVYEHIHVW
ncbi:PREDICTED: uncharacterized protein LOC103342375 [Prunus mume]|uniref:Uncharacterized protein LOC103342375 n=1 Tax=Prunus mume TaxID=102107 RepID=A0ABM0PTG9_PRUMU|nr:PREDICTED: uncharacterized protein LOC103342375 [Prunus mume]